MHAQQIPGGAPPPTLPIPMHPSLAPGQLAGLQPNNNNGPTPSTPQQLAMLTKQELMLHSRPEDGNGGGGVERAGKSGANDENRHVSFVNACNKILLMMNAFLEKLNIAWGKISTTNTPFSIGHDAKLTGN